MTKAHGVSQWSAGNRGLASVKWQEGVILAGKGRRKLRDGSRLQSQEHSREVIALQEWVGQPYQGQDILGKAWILRRETGIL